MTNNSNAFVSPQFYSDKENMGMMPMTLEENKKQTSLAAAQSDELDNLYPEIYWEVYPLVSEVADKMIAANYRPNPNTMGIIVDNIIKNGGLWYEDDDDDQFSSPEAIPVQFGFGGLPFMRRRRRYHNRNTLRDIIRILLLRELLGRRRGPFRGF